MIQSIGRLFQQAITTISLSVGILLFSPWLLLLLFVSGRTSFEIVQKAFLAGIPVLVSVSAPSTLAIDLAVATGMTLVGFVRGNSFNVYAHPERIEM